MKGGGQGYTCTVKISICVGYKRGVPSRGAVNETVLAGVENVFYYICI